jgi:hypothetical protein
MTNGTESDKRRGKHRSASLVVLAIALSGVVLAACGGGAATSAPPTSTKSTTTTTTAPKSSSSSASSTAFTTCLKQHGVTGSGFGSGKKPSGSATGSRPAGGFGGNSKTSAAFKACASLRPAGSGFGGGGGAGVGAGVSSTQLAAFRNCMTLHGVTIAKKTAGSAPTANSSVTSSPKYKTALAACKSLIPTPTKTPATTTTGG